MSEKTVRTGIASVTPVESTKVEIHEPRVYVTDECAESCKRLGKYVTKAMESSVRRPSAQFDVVCEGKVRFGCNASEVCSGIYGAGFGNRVDGSDELFLVNPSGYYEQPGGPAEVVARAIEAGLEPRKATEINK